MFYISKNPVAYAKQQVRAKAWREKNKYYKKYYAKNRAKYLEYYYSNKEKILSQIRSYYWANHEKELKRHKAYYYAHRKVKKPKKFLENHEKIANSEQNTTKKHQETPQNVNV